MRKKRGSILIYVMVIFAVLMIMGSTLTTLTLQSMKNRKHYSNNRVNLYYSESGIDEAYGITAEYVENASNDALNKTNGKIEELINKDKEYLEEIFKLTERLKSDLMDQADRDRINIKIQELTNKLVLLDISGNLEDDALKKRQIMLYGTNYIGYFQEASHNDASHKNIDQLVIDMKKNNVGSNGILITAEDEIGSLVDTTYSDLLLAKNALASKTSLASKTLSDIKDTFKTPIININMKSTFENENIEKIISADLEIIIPDYGSKITFLSKYIIFPKSPIWSKGILVNKTLNINKGSLIVNGDVYVKGEDQAILLNTSESNLTVNSGDVTAGEGIKFNYDDKVGKSIGAKVSIGKSLYTKGILFNKEKDTDTYTYNGAQGATLKVTDSIYVLDDCEINAKNSTLDVVEGSYYGVSNGDYSEGNEVDNSSSIIINSEDLEVGGSTIDIGGKVYLAGTAYINGLNNPAYNSGYAYQTGESISIKGNYKAYAETLQNSLVIDGIDLKYELEKTMLDPLILATHYKKHSTWFDIYGDEIYIGMDTRLREKYEDWDSPYKIKITELENKEYKIGKKELLSETEITLINSLDELNIELIKSDGTGEKIIVQKLEDNFEAFLSTGNKVIAIMTPRGELDDSINVIDKVEVDGKQGVLNDFIEVSSTLKIEDSISVDLYDSGNNLVDTVILKSYSDYFEDFDLTNKSKYFAQFYNDDTENKIINKGDSIKIGKIEASGLNDNLINSIYTGAIISGGTAASTNYYDDGVYNDYRVRQRKAMLKDEILYMGMFEKKYFNGSDGTDEINEIGGIEILDYEALCGIKDIKNDTGDLEAKLIYLEKQANYKLTPENLLTILGAENDFAKTGLYISTADETKFPNGTVENGSHGIIICDGDVVIDENFDFTGTLITLGNLTVKGGKTVNITYDEALVKQVIAMNYDKLMAVFKDKNTDEYKGGYEFDQVKVEIYDSENEKKIEGCRPLKIKKWAVIK